jgi:hypothetical protein
MLRTSLLAIIVAAVGAVPVEAKRAIRIFTPVEKVARAELVVAGKVTAVEKQLVDAIRFPGDTEKVGHKVVVIKIDKGLVGGDTITHVKVGFVPPPPPADPNVPVRPGRGGFQPIDLKEGQEGIFFLTKHPSGEFYTITPLLAPLDPQAENYKTQVELVKKAAAVLADPMKSLKSGKAEDRYFAATALLTKYRAYPETGGEVDTIKLPVEESRLILKSLAEGDWKKYDPDTINGMQAFYQLALTEKDGWKQPQPKPGADFADTMKEAFIKWLDGPGKDYQIGKVVPKK